MNKVLIMALAAGMLVSGCKTREVVVEVPTMSHDTIIDRQLMRDSIYLHDSTFVMVSGDTVFLERWHTHFRDRWRTDTLIDHRRDTVTMVVEVPVVKEVPASLSAWQRVRMVLGNGVIAFGLLAVGLYLIKRKG